jgi:dienelactone hydrolase
MKMNSHLHIDKLVCVILLTTILSSACAPTPASTPTLEPTATQVSTPAPNHPALILAINKPFRQSPYSGNVVYTLPEMDKVLLASELAYYNDLTVDIYYPPNYNFEAKLPIVILSHGFPSSYYGDKDMTSHIDWAKLIAASGMIAISAQSGDDPIQNSYHVFDFLAANADFLSVDLTRVGFWSCSSQSQPVFTAFQDKNHPFREAFKAAVFLYSDLGLADPSVWPQNLSLFVVRAGNDQGTSVVDMDNFVAQARSNNIPTEYIVLEGAPHAFDIYQNTQASKDTVQRALDFYKNILLT